MTDRKLMQQALDALESISRYGLDTLSGRIDGPDDRNWQRAAVVEMTNRAMRGHDALRARLAQPEPEPVAYWNFESGFDRCEQFKLNEAAKDKPAPLYLAPSQHEWQNVSDAQLIDEVRRRGFVIKDAAIHEWQGLTDEEQGEVAWSCGAMSADWLDFARAIEAKLKEKNT